MTKRQSKRAKCLCGCGQAPSTTCRERKAECRSCGYVARVTRKWLATVGPPICACNGEAMECRCLEDRMVTGDDAAYSGMLDRAAMPYSTGRRTGTHDNRTSKPLAGNVPASAMPF